jgi:hypothetical protein
LALWEAKAITAPPLPLFARDLDGEGIAEPRVELPPMTPGEEVVEDYVAMRLTLKAHPVALLRHLLSPGWIPPPPGPARATLSPFSGTTRTIVSEGRECAATMS